MAQLPGFCLRGWTLRRLHSTLALVTSLPLLSTVVTGVSYRFCRNALGFEKSSVHWLLSVHTLSFLSLHTLYPPLLSLLTLALMLTAFPLGPLAASLTTLTSRLLPSLSSSSSSPRPPPPRSSSPSSPSSLSLPRLTPRLLHRYLTLALLPPLLSTALTGLLWTLSRHYLHQPKEAAAYLMAIHQGSYTGSPVAYTLSLGLLSVVALAPGVMLMGWWKRWVSGSLVGGGVGGVGTGGRGGDGVMYTMLNVKNAFEREEDDEEEEGDGRGMGRPGSSGSGSDGAERVQVSDESESPSS